MPHKPCPPCPAPSDDSGPPKTTGASVWSLDIVPPSAKSDYIVCNSRACRDGVAIKHGAVISSSVERAPLLDDGGTGHAGTPSWCSDPCPKGATALTSYWSDSLQDTLTTASKPPADGGYKSVHVEGYCLEDKPPLSSTLGASTQLLQYWSAARNDSFLVLKGGHWEAVAKQQGYVQRGAPECWALTPPPSSCRNGTDCGGTNLWTPWRSEPPDPSYTNPGAGMPVPRSSDILDWEYKSGANPGYGGVTSYPPGGPNWQVNSADTWYPSWGADGNLYSPWTDGAVLDGETGELVGSSSSGEAANGYNSTTGQAVIVGDDPFALNITRVKTFTSATFPYAGRYPCGTLMVNGTWFYGTYMLDNQNENIGGNNVGPNPGPNCGNWCVQGPLVSFRHSTDKGETWDDPKMNATDGRDNLFHETAADNSRVKFGAPHWVDFGQDMQHSPDGKAYLVGHGAVSPRSIQAWMLGDQIYMARVTPTVAAVNDVSQWEFYAGGGHGDAARWVRGNISAAEPLLDWTNHTGVVTMSYLAGLRKYIMVVSTASVYPFMAGAGHGFDTYFLESESLTGPWHYITYMRNFGPEAYFVNHPTKFAAKRADTSNRRFDAFLMYSANFADSAAHNKPENSGYHMNLQQARLSLSHDFAAKLEAAYKAMEEAK